MADVGARFRMSANDRDRGQLLLVAGLTIAVILVALVLLLNTVIYTENVATRGLDTETDDALQYRATVVDSVEEIIAQENRRSNANYGTLEDNVTNGTALLHESLNQRHLERGAIADLSLDHRGGIHAWQESSSDFTPSGSSDANWTVATGIDDVKRFNMTVERSSLRSLSEAFTIDIGVSTSIQIYENGTHIIVDDGSDSCATTTDPATIDLINHTLDGGDCPALNWSESPPYDVDFVLANHTAGTYAMTVSDQTSITPSDVPNYTYVIYDADVEITYQSRDVDYQTTVHVEGAEPR